MPELSPDTDAALIAAARAYFAERRARVPGFVRERFGLRGTLRLHRHALGWDILKAPLNVMLSPVLILSRLAAWGAGRAGAPRIARWLASRRILLPTAVARATERAIVVDLLELPWDGPGRASERDALARAILANPTLARLVATRREAGAVSARALSDYGGTRSAVAEMTTALGTIGAGAVAFQSLTPGMVSFAPGLAAVLAQQAAIAAFPLGGLLGSAWYGVFPAVVSPWLTAGLTLGLVALGALVAAFAGVIADPVQAALGLHRRRLNRLIDAMEDAFTGEGRRGFAAREHYLARLLDLSDAGLAAIRLLTP
ncbi:hypothetical protein SAMN05444722_2992 [Rhodovulum sp. ES.010]|uniref:DUF6635 family protein n=1 Tax=Rhodovulum sp. ES.010 TaxID=1882821 RepID=UPI000925E836|nr:DUF6635 family protein [Rhodovulum sp. ES.010]SIO51871.1 hypothetical protein SAMN05444722_2992 [Rhodovulum sp. ES.010]